LVGCRADRCSSWSAPVCHICTGTECQIGCYLSTAVRAPVALSLAYVTLYSLLPHKVSALLLALA
jgi:hypothetical protein